MRAVVQRVLEASVSVDGLEVSSIGKGLMVLAGLCREDNEKDMDYVAEKIAGLRIFPDGNKEGVFSVRDIGGEILLVSQFTLYGDVKKGKRPSFTEAMPADSARNAFQVFADKLISQGVPVKQGIFQADMRVALANDGPYTILLDSK